MSWTTLYTWTETRQDSHYKLSSPSFISVSPLPYSSLSLKLSVSTFFPFSFQFPPSSLLFPYHSLHPSPLPPAPQSRFSIRASAACETVDAASSNLLRSNADCSSNSSGTSGWISWNPSCKLGRFERDADWRWLRHVHNIRGRNDVILVVWTSSVDSWCRKVWRKM